MALVVVVPVIILLYFIFVLGTATISRQLSAGVTAWLKDAGRVAGFVLGPTVTLTLKLTRWITSQVGEVFSDAERLAVAWFSGLYQWAALAIGQALSWPIYLFKLQWWIVNHAIPNAIRAAIRGFHGSVTYVTKVLPKVERVVTKLPKLTKAQIRAAVTAALSSLVLPFMPELRWIRAHFHAITHAIPGAITLPKLPSIRDVLRRLRKLEKGATRAAFAAALAVALGRLGLGWIRCNNVKKAGKSVCGIDMGLLDELLLGTTAIFGAISVVEFAEGLRAIEGEAVSVMGKLVREWPA